jgi:hypothetical protein
MVRAIAGGVAHSDHGRDIARLAVSRKVGYSIMTRLNAVAALMKIPQRAANQRYCW